jgi:hypothetical protein
VSMIFRVSKFAIRAFQAIGSEMFRLTEATRGALLLILVMFYFAFVLGEQCRGELASCFREGRQLSNAHLFACSLVLWYRNVVRDRDEW